MAARRRTRTAKRTSFNGAMAVRPWMGARAELAVADHIVLQWGHGREAMDGRPHAGAGQAHPASMGPWP